MAGSKSLNAKDLLMKFNDATQEATQPIEAPSKKEDAEEFSPILVKDPLETIEVRQNVENCCIGKKWYSFKAGQKYKVPIDVAQVLRESGKL